ncbi:piggyBac transposable element-derived protein 1-like [Dermacentor silvarum]|uniref:piggyBac transposable element-derived protein 1-like n=1 Tax=Dermacentor silvarum TaxID=543639 RepID=UPI002100EFA1|nr:piggyBac transposable element-derived protein 1-like [Dermacentor silvarum]
MAAASGRVQATAASSGADGAACVVSPVLRGPRESRDGALLSVVLSRQSEGVTQMLFFTDRYFTGFKLGDYLLEEKVFLTSTVMANRTGGVAVTMPQDVSMQRGQSHCKLRSDEKMCVVQDTKSVLLFSAFGTEPEGKCKRWAKHEKKKVDVTQPGVVSKYNASMCGVDIIDRYISYYRISLRKRKWTVRVFAPFLDFACCNSWIEYQRDCERALSPRKDRLDLLAFNVNIVSIFLKADN